MKNQSQKDILRYYSKEVLKRMRDSYINKKRSNLIADGFTFEKYVKKAFELGYLDSDSHQIRRIDTTKKFNEDNVYLKNTDGLQAKLRNMSKIIKKTERHKIALKINEKMPYQICMRHPNRKNERRIYIKQ